MSDKRKLLRELNKDYNEYDQFSTINNKKFGERKK